MGVHHSERGGAINPPCFTLLLANHCGGAGGAGRGSDLGTSQGPPVLGTLVENM